MQRTELKSKINKLIRQYKPEVDKLIDKAINSGALDIESAEDNYMLPKIILAAVYAELSNQYMPFDKQAKKQVANLKIFL